LAVYTIGRILSLRYAVASVSCYRFQVRDSSDNTDAADAAITKEHTHTGSDKLWPLGKLESNLSSASRAKDNAILVLLVCERPVAGRETNCICVDDLNATSEGTLTNV